MSKYYHATLLTNVIESSIPYFPQLKKNLSMFFNLVGHYISSLRCNEFKVNVLSKSLTARHNSSWVCSVAAPVYLITEE